MYSNILVPIDGSITSMKAMEEAARLARLTQGEVCLLHVVDLLINIPDFEAPALSLSELQPAIEQAGEELLAKAKAQLDKEGVKVRTELYKSSGIRVSEAILNSAREQKADIIVIGTHGRRGFERMMMGSDAEQVVRSSPVPVLLVRHR
ncbi:hypothetical protein CAI21_12115 [Alkalilimnicola ehrlichii]|uniref:Universal stress protein n=1 Tax=Alkalilimnicola ehrlichii TaxID=351052 RepID=A0A3E0WUD5_9GAMM|nr:universal stress protein [Alkalilimnicola ehrlichii]RFA28597.1 hypothetical protein CAI21_12115 [Alkalilimnicola ehrlichii]RFA35761.1 hypothetical protein CAL65_12635 [Alkalilimnicola ehrlichii]